MRFKIILSLVFSATAIFGAFFISSNQVSAQADINYPAIQETNWGLKTTGASRTVNRFSTLGFALAEANGKMFVGGNFLEVTNGDRTESQPYLAAFDVRTGVWDESFTPSVGGAVLDIENSPDGKMWLGGEIDTLNGSQLGAFVTIDPTTGNVDNSFPTRIYGGTSVVRDITLESDGWLYIAGAFTTANDGGNPISVKDIIRVNPETGLIDRSWLPNIETFHGLFGVSASKTNDSVYLAGRSNNTSKNQGLIAVDRNNSSTITWDGFRDNRSSGWMYDVEATVHGTVFIAGTEHGSYIHDEANNMDIIMSHVTSSNSDYQPNNTRRGGDYQDISIEGDTVYMTCHCWGSHSSKSSLIDYRVAWDLAFVDATYTGSVNAVIAYDIRTGVRKTEFNPYMSGDVGGWDTVKASDGCLWITGGFNAVGETGNQSPGRDLVRLCIEGGGTPPEIASTEECLATVSGEMVTVSWDEVAEAEDYVIRRSVDGSTPSWRGVTTDTSLIDNNRDAALVYYVETRSGVDRSERTTCTTTIETPPPETQPVEPTNCEYKIINDAVEVSWTATPNAETYVVYRSVDESNQFWRGTSSTNNFIDTTRGTTLEYFVLATYEDRTRSNRVSCNLATVTPPPVPEPIANVNDCQVAVNNNNKAIISWDSIDDATAEYIVSRSVNGGKVWWRGRVNALSFEDTLRAGEIVYYVEAASGNERSERTLCSPVIEG